MTTTPVDPATGGVLLVDKPSGPTSHDVVDLGRRGLGVRRIGHTGTLDPFATGLLLLCIGPATRLVEYLHALSKRYLGTVRLGIATDTHDSTGSETARSDCWREVRRDRVEEALAALRATALQRPPAFSAKRVEGERAHRAARRGRRVELAPAEVRVHSLHLLDFTLPDLVLETEVGTGTYVRALARDLGTLLDCPAHLARLRRSAIGPFRVGDAVAADGLRSDAPLPAAAWRSPADALAWLPRRPLSAEEHEDVRHGRPVDPEGVLRPEVEVDPPPDPAIAAELVALVRGGRLVAVARREEGRLQPRKVLDAA